MSKTQKGKPAAVSYEQALAELPNAEAALATESAEYTQAYEQSIRELHRLHGVMAREKVRTAAARLRVDTLRDIVDKGNGAGKRALTFRLVPNPSITQGLLDAVASGEVETKHQSSQTAAFNEALLVGGLSRVKSRTEAQFLAAARYCSLYEQSQIGGARATDYSQVRVDTSGPRQDQISARQDDTRKEIEGARKAMGERATSIVDRVVVYGASIRDLAQNSGHGTGGQGRRRAEAELLAALDVLVEHFGLLPPESPRQRRWSDGSKARIVREDPETA